MKKNSSLVVFEISSATNEVVTLKSGILKSFDMMLKMEIDTPAEANSTGPSIIFSPEAEGYNKFKKLKN